MDLSKAARGIVVALLLALLASVGSHLANNYLAPLLVPILSLVPSKSVIVLLLVGIGNAGLAAVPVAYIYHFREESIAEYVRLRVPTVNDVVVAGLGFVGTMALYYAASIVIALLNTETASNSSASAASSSPEVAVGLIAASVVFIGPVEEFVFRGTVQTRVTEVLPTAAGIAVATAIFAVSHLPALQGAGKATTVIALVAVSLPEAITYEYTDSLAVPIAIHALYDLTLFLGILLQNTGAA